MRRYSTGSGIYIATLLLLMALLISVVVLAIVTRNEQLAQYSELEEKYGFTVVEEAYGEKIDQTYMTDQFGRLYVLIRDGTGRSSVGGIVPVLDADGAPVIYSP